MHFLTAGSLADLAFWDEPDIVSLLTDRRSVAPWPMSWTDGKVSLTHQLINSSSSSHQRVSTSRDSREEQQPFTTQVHVRVG